MKHLAKNIVNTYEKETNTELKNIPEPPDYKQIEDHKEAKSVMKNYLENVMNIVEDKASKNTVETIKMIEKARDILSDPKFINQDNQQNRPSGCIFRHTL